MKDFTLYFFCFSLSIIITGLVRYYALSNMMDIPNERSSHDKPTPRGGGLAFALLFILCLLFFKTSFSIANDQFIALLVPGLIVGSIGFIDDKKGLPALRRLMGHLGSAAFALLILGTLPSTFFGYLYVPSAILFLFSLMYLTWLLNLYNFMDGIDGLAAMEAVFVCIAMSFIYHYNAETTAEALPLLLAVLVAGFLCWNFPPAKIFMGDVGSGFLGISLGILSLIGAQLSIHYFFAWLILLGIFIIDASFTLLERILKKEAIWEAHRNHAYQKAALYFASHKQVTLMVLCINLLWLFPLALLVSQNCLNDWLGLIIAYVPIMYMTYRMKQKKPNQLL